MRVMLEEVGLFRAKEQISSIYESNGQLYTQMALDVKKQSLIGIIDWRISVERVIHSENWPAYDGLA